MCLWEACLGRVNILKGDPGGEGGGSGCAALRPGSAGDRSGGAVPPVFQAEQLSSTERPASPRNLSAIRQRLERCRRTSSVRLDRAPRATPGTRNSPLWGLVLWDQPPPLPTPPRSPRSVIVRFPPDRPKICKAFVKPSYPTGITTFSRHPSRARVDGTRLPVFPSPKSYVRSVRVFALC